MMQNKLEESLCIAVGSEIMTKMALPKTDWAANIFTPEVVGYGDTPYANVQWNAWGLMSALFILEGDVAFFGIKEDQIEGNSFVDKKSSMLRYTVDDYNRKASNGGFYVHFVNGVGPDGQSILVVPSGFVLATAGLNARYVRWALVADQADVNRATRSIAGILEAFPEYNAESTGYPQWAAHLGVRM